MRKTVKLFALLGVSAVIATAVYAAVGTFWFKEDAASFAEGGTYGTWKAAPGAAAAVGSSICVSSVDSEVLDRQEARFTPSTSAGGDLVTTDHTVVFDSVGTDFDPGDAFSGVQIMDNGGKLVFAVVDASSGTGVWRATDVEAETNVVYEIRFAETFTEGSAYVLYSYRKQGVGSYSDIAVAGLPKTAKKLSSVAFSGNGKVNLVESGYGAPGSSKTGLYLRWSYADAIATWQCKNDTAIEYVYLGNDTWGAGERSWVGDELYAALPSLALRFGSEKRQGTKSITAAVANYYGILLESKVTGFSISCPTDHTPGIRLGDPLGKTATWFYFQENFTFKSPTTKISGATVPLYPLTFLGEVNLDILSGKAITATQFTDVKLDPATFTRLKFHGSGTLKVTKLTATGAVTLDFSDYTQVTSTKGVTTYPITGNLEIDGSTSFALPAGVKAGEEYQLCSGTLTGGSATPSVRTVTVGGVAYSVEVAFNGNKITYQPRTYPAHWRQYPAIFTWAGSDPTFAAGAFNVYDLDQCCDNGTTYAGSGAYADVPGWDGVIVPQFNWVFSANDVSKTVMPFSRDCGYALRFAGGTGVGGNLASDANPLALGGLMVENGASGFAIGGDASGRGIFAVGDYYGSSTNHIDIAEDFSVRNRNLEFIGRVELNVAAGKTLTVSAEDGAVPTCGTAPNHPEIVFGGEGHLVCHQLWAAGPVTLDFSRLAGSTAFIEGGLNVDVLNRIVFPADYAADTPFKLCTGTLLAADAVYAVALGEGEFALKNITFDLDNCTMAYSDCACSPVTLSADLTWTDFKSKVDVKKPVVVTLTKDVRLTVNEADSSLPTLLVLGPYRLSIVMEKNAAIGQVFLGREARCEFVYNEDSEAIAGDLTLEGGNAFDYALEGASGLYLNQKLTLGGRVITRGTVTIGNSESTIDEHSSLVIESGKLTIPSTLHADKTSYRIVGELCIQGTGWEPGDGSIIEFGEGGTITASDYDEGFPIEINSPAVIRGRGPNAYIEVPMACRASVACDLAESAELGFAGGEGYNSDDACLRTYGAGSLSIGAMTELVFASDTFAKGGLSGSGRAIFSGDPSATGISTSLGKSTWSGTCHLRDADVPDLDPANFGNARSRLAFEGCNGYFAREPVMSPVIELIKPSSAYPCSLRLDTGYDHTGVTLRDLCGSGSLVVGEAPANGRYRVFVPANASFDGSLEVRGLGSLNAIVVGATETEKATAFDAYDGMVAVLDGAITINEYATWNATQGIYVRGAAEVTDEGEIQCKVIGNGTVKYTSMAGGSHPEPAAEFSDPGWQGRVCFSGMLLDKVDFNDAGNTGSVVAVEGCAGSLKPGWIVPAVETVGTGLTVTSVDQDSATTFSKLLGTGLFRLSADEYDYDFRILDASEYEGSIDLASETGALLFGEVVREGGGTMVFPDEFKIRSGRDWHTPKAVFGKVLNVVGAANDILMYVTGGMPDYYNVKVNLVGSSDTRVRVRLEYDGIDKCVYLAPKPTPPTMTVDSLVVDYGTDFTNSTIGVYISNYWEGYAYDGLTVAEVLVYDRKGNLVCAGSTAVDGNGRFDIHGLDLPAGQGGDYRYEIVVTTEESDTGVLNNVDNAAINAPGVRLAGDWFSENARTFASEDPGTGTWLLPTPAPASGSAAYVTNGFIRIDSANASGPVKFQSTVTESNDVLRIDSYAIFDGIGVLEVSPSLIAGMKSGVTLTMDEESSASGRKTFAVLRPAENRFESAWCRVEPQVGVEYLVSQFINRKTGYVSYSIDGNALTNAAGESAFKLRDEDCRATFAGVGFNGAGYVETAAGNQYNGNVAAVTTGGKTNEYLTVDEAVAAAYADGSDKVLLLWDATWRPRVEDAGRPMTFDKNGHTLSLDPKAVEQLRVAGYTIADDGSGKYVISVIDWSVGFDANGGTGEMSPVGYSVTNMSVKLPLNAFMKPACDFAGWNTEADGSGPTNYADGATVDLTPYGQTNLTFYAQWRTAVRTVTIEPADEFVYVEAIYTNEVLHSGAHYFRADAAKATGRVEIPLENGSSLKVVFSTDIEKSLSYIATNWESVISSMTVEHLYLPVTNGVYVGSDKIKEALELWAEKNGISSDELSKSPYAKVSCSLQLDHLLEETSVIEITDFTIDGEGCSFKAKVDGKAVTAATALKPLVRLATQLSPPNWAEPAEDKLSAEADGTVRVKSDAGTFIKLVVE